MSYNVSWAILRSLLYGPLLYGPLFILCGPALVLVYAFVVMWRLVLIIFYIFYMHYLVVVNSSFLMKRKKEIKKKTYLCEAQDTTVSSTCSSPASPSTAAADCHCWVLTMLLVLCNLCCRCHRRFDMSRWLGMCWGATWGYGGHWALCNGLKVGQCWRCVVVAISYYSLMTNNY